MDTTTDTDGGGGGATAALLQKRARKRTRGPEAAAAAAAAAAAGGIAASRLQLWTDLACAAKDADVPRLVELCKAHPRRVRKWTGLAAATASLVEPARRRAVYAALFVYGWVVPPGQHALDTLRFMFGAPMPDALEPSALKKAVLNWCQDRPENVDLAVAAAAQAGNGVMAVECLRVCDTGRRTPFPLLVVLEGYPATGAPTALQAAVVMPDATLRRLLTLKILERSVTAYVLSSSALEPESALTLAASVSQDGEVVNMLLGRLVRDGIPAAMLGGACCRALEQALLKGVPQPDPNLLAHVTPAQLAALLGRFASPLAAVCPNPATRERIGTARALLASALKHATDREMRRVLLSAERAEEEEAAATAVFQEQLRGLEEVHLLREEAKQAALLRAQLEDRDRLLGRIQAYAAALLRTAATTGSGSSSTATEFIDALAVTTTTTTTAPEFEPMTVLEARFKLLKGSLDGLEERFAKLLVPAGGATATAAPPPPPPRDRIPLPQLN